jgi:hypothetical protein
MTNEQLRMQMLSGIITEGEYKEKLEENKFLNFFKKKEDSNISVFKKERDKLINNVNNDEKLSDEEKSKSIKDIKDAFMAQVRQYDMLENKKSLNENFVGIGAINNPFAKREKTGYETAFEHFLSERYETKFENREQDLEEDKDPDIYKAEGMKVTFLKQDEMETLPEEPTNEYEEDVMDAYLFDVDQHLFDRTYSSLEDLAQTIVDENGGDVANWVSILNRMVENGIISIG